MSWASNCFIILMILFYWSMATNMELNRKDHFVAVAPLEVMHETTYTVMQLTFVVLMIIFQWNMATNTQLKIERMDHWNKHGFTCDNLLLLYLFVITSLSRVAVHASSPVLSVALREVPVRNVLTQEDIVFPTIVRMHLVTREQRYVLGARTVGTINS